MRTERDETKQLHPHGFPVRSVLSIKEFRRYTDPILQAAILRAAYSAEVRRSDESEEEQRTNWTRDMLRCQEETGLQLRRELLINILMEKLPEEALDGETLRLLRKEGFSEFCDLFESNEL